MHETSLPHAVTLRPVRPADSEALAAAYAVNREHLRQWEPVRTENFFTAEHQAREIAGLVASRVAGTGEAFVLEATTPCGRRIIGRVTVSGLVRGAFESANLGYWIDANWAGRGIMTAAVEAVAEFARTELRLHRLQAGTLLHNAGSQTVLLRAGFEQFGMAPKYLLIDGRWQDHLLFQRILHD